ncbi:MAG: hypothetical protein ACYDEJ_03165 [Desulfitobacteriaceae bacterium]
MAFEKITATERYLCQSSDTKLTVGIKKSALAKETDTMLEFIFNGVAWIPYSQPVSIVGSLAKVSASQTRPDNITPYIAGDVVGTDPATSMTFSSVGTTAGKGFMVVSVDVEIDVASIPSGMTGFRLHLYDTAPTAIIDNAAYNLPSGDRAKYLGNIILNTPSDVGDTLWSHTDNINFIAKLASDSTTLYGILETLGAYTPTALIVKKVILYVMEV